MTEADRDDTNEDPDAHGIAPARIGEPVIQAISRAVQMLSLFTEEHPEITLGQLVSRFGLGKTTTHRYATSLRQEGLLRYNARTGRYSLGIRLIRFGRIAQTGLHVLEVAGPHLDSLAQDLNESAVLAIWDVSSPVVVRVAYPPRRNFYIAVRVGDRLTRHAAQSLVMRAYFEAEQDSNPELAEVRRRGYAVTEYHDIGMVAIARPVFQDEQIVATIATVGTLATIGDDNLESVIERLGVASVAISRDLGGFESLASI